MTWTERKAKWAEINLRQQEAERSSAEWVALGVVAFIAVYLFTVAVLSLAHPW